MANRLKTYGTFILFGTLSCVPHFALAASTFPDHAVHFIVGFPPGGGTDVTARFVGQKLSEMWGQPVTVENKAGADGSIAADVVAHSKPDGYTVGWVSNAHTITGLMYKLNYDPITSFAPITLATSMPDVLVVNPSVPVNTVQELITYTKAHPNQLNYGTTAGGTSSDLETAQLIQETGMKMVDIPFKGSGDGSVALLGNEIQVMLISISSTLPQIKAGKLKALAVSTGTRSPVLPDVPTIAEAAKLPDFSSGVWYGALAPAGTPRDIVNKLNKDMVSVLRSAAFQSITAPQGFIIVGDTPDEFASEMKNEMVRWSKVLKK